MKENRIAARLDDIFSDARISTLALAMVTKRVLSRQAEATIDEWYMAHKLAVNPDISGQEMLDFVEQVTYDDIVDLSEWS